MIRRRAKREGPPRRGALPLSSRDPAKLPVTTPLGGADPHRGKDPAHGCRRPRRETMRHWITSKYFSVQSAAFNGRLLRPISLGFYGWIRAIDGWLRAIACNDFVPL